MKMVTDHDFSGERRKPWQKNDEPVVWLINHLLKDGTPDDLIKLYQTFFDTYTYLYLCDAGAMALGKETLVELYEAEQEDGLYGFMLVLLRYEHDLLEELLYDLKLKAKEKLDQAVKYTYEGRA